MARRTKSSPAENLIELMAMLPWWGGVVLALASYLLLHSFASQPVVVVTQAEQMNAILAQPMLKAPASFGQLS